MQANMSSAIQMCERELSALPEEGIICVTGSLHAVGEALKIVHKSWFSFLCDSVYSHAFQDTSFVLLFLFLPRLECIIELSVRTYIPFAPVCLFVMPKKPLIFPSFEFWQDCVINLCAADLKQMFLM